ncbi:hypothetical protein KDL01_38795 [Actinospica durhamensis]|uniref:DUF3466 family protein n=1 Tax=Actinospica durhamensis TaxID=1508375 RepID=A0A941F0K2_9ACTN|nr:hypothetical protein [Actinospica durhamensis]MBR7839274.1 hypothetical protein [Actinospica durhamensis]
MRRRTMLAAVLAAGTAIGTTAAGTTTASAATATYTITDLGTLGYVSSSGGGLNATGLIDGVSSLAVTVPAGSCPPKYGVRKPCVEHLEHAFRFSGGAMTDLGTLGGQDSAATAVNAAGTLVGSADTAAGYSHAFVEVGGTMTDLGTLDGAAASSEALAINSSGQVAGWSTAAGATGNHAILDVNGTMTDLGTIDGGTSSVANGINDAGVVIGNSDTSSSDERGFVYQDGKITDVGTLGGPNSSVNAINDGGVVTGSSQDAADVSHPFIYANGIMTSLGTYNIDTTPQAINDAGVIVGTTYGVNAAGDPFDDAFIYQAGTFQDLNTMIHAGSGWELTDAVGINADGQVLVDATNTTNGQNHALLLTPTS